MRAFWFLFLTGLTAAFSGQATGQGLEGQSGADEVGTSGEAQASGVTQQADCSGSDCTLIYPRSFFDQYTPITALDIVNNTPGFQLDEGDQSRGFAGAAGNVLINGERPSAKSETAAQILSRLAADTVKEIQLIRGQSGGLDLRGQSVAVNVILVAGGQQSTTYEVGYLFRTPLPGEPMFFSNISHTRSSDWFDVTVGAVLDRRGFQSFQDELVLGPSDEILEVRDEFFQEVGFNWKLSLNGTARLGDYKLSLNAAYSHEDRGGGESSERSPTDGSPSFVLVQGGDDGFDQIEVGGDIERDFGQNWSAKVLGLYRQNDFFNRGSLLRGPTEDEVLLATLSDLNGQDTETIGRLEIDYSGWKNHILELSGEYAINTLNSNFGFSRASVPGDPLVVIPVPGADTNIREERADFTLSDSWTLGKLVVDTTLAAETSTITQSGDLSNSRSFNFFKPSLALSYSPTGQTQYRARIERLVGQLDFNDFASSTDLGDDELALGNPELQPDTRWRYSLAGEWRFGGLGSLTLTAFHEQISDVIDVLLAGPGLEATGNIGSATRSGIEYEGTLPLTFLGLKNVRLDFRGQFQQSSVVDPILQTKRRLSNEQSWDSAIEFRQDFNVSKISWGGIIELGGWSPIFGTDEFDRGIRQADLDLFFEATRFGGLRFRVEIGNTFANGRRRDRRVFDGLRGIDPILFREERARDFGIRVNFGVRGTF